MIYVKRNHKLCKNCEKGYLCNTPKCKYTIKNNKIATRYTKQKIIKYLKENNIEFICAEYVQKLLIEIILKQKNILKNLIQFVK